MIPVPTHRAVVDVGHKCNVGCKHCYNKHEAKKVFRSAKEILVDIDAAKDRGNTYVDFTGGEPTIHPNIAAIVRYVNSIGMKCCIITNAIDSSQVDDIVAAGIDDWLISTHGDADAHDVLVHKGAREKQEEFIRKLDTLKQTYRFNCCILSYNVLTLDKFATWAKQWGGLRIVNFINFNPHGQWGNDVEGTRQQMADLDTAEDMLGQAIAILEEAGKGINVRYFPMCRIAPAYRKYVCNDLQVMFDPYEWDYNVEPKTYKRYLRYAHELSAQNEWKAAPCVACTIRYVCGGINSNFLNASGNKNIIHPVTDVEKTYDIYHYRRQNAVVLQDRNPNMELCIAAIADETMRFYVPLFIVTAATYSPDYHIRVFTRYNNHAPVRAIVDAALGEGFYDSVVRDVPYNDEISFAGAATASMRFVLFDEELLEFNSVLWTDIDMMFYGSDDIVNINRNYMTADKTQCYTNTQCSGNRLGGVHFITRGWWELTKEHRLNELHILSLKSEFTEHYDEEMLYRIVQNSGLSLSPVTLRRDRYHAVHLGDWIYADSARRVPAVTVADEEAIRRFVADSVISRVLHACAGEYNCVAQVEDVWISTYHRKSSQSLAQKYQEQVQRDLAGQPKKRKKFVRKHYEGRLGVFTICDANYAWFAPLFVYSIAKYLSTTNDVAVTIGIRGGVPEDVRAEVMRGLAGTSFGVDRVNLVDVAVAAPDTGYTTAALRFTEGDVMSDYAYTLITDIDILLMPEEMTIIDQHMMHIERDGTGVYENWISEDRDGFPRLPGVHFVLQPYWYETSQARAKYRNELIATGASAYWHDEVMLGKIVVESGLLLPPRAPKLWRKHGPHLGDIRIDLNRKHIYDPSVWERMHIDNLLRDPLFMSLVERASGHISYLNDVIKYWKRLNR